MLKDTLTLVLSGDVLLSDYAAALEHFRKLIEGLSEEVAPGEPIDWSLDDLERSSALTTIRGRSRGEDQAPVEQVVSAFGQVGDALTSGQPVPFSGPVVAAASSLVSLIDERIESLRLETPDEDWIISASDFTTGTEDVIVGGPTYGSVEGRIQTLSNRGGLRFTLFDTLHDKAVSCYLAEGHEDEIRNAWGRLALVEGVVKRDPASSRPLTIRQVTSIELLPEGTPESYRQARGSVPRRGERAEEVIRRLRDAQ